MSRSTRLRSWLLSAAVGLVAAVLGVLLAEAILPARAVARTFWEVEAGLGLGILAGLFVASRSDASLRPALRWTAVAFGTAALLVAGLDLVIDDPWSRKKFGYWSPVPAGLGLALWLVGGAFERIRGRRLPGLTALLLGTAIAAASLQMGHDLDRSLKGERVRSWNVYHYYVGSKYFRELGYHDLYAATLAADDEYQARRKAGEIDREQAEREGTHKSFKSITRARDMHTYRTRGREHIVAEYDRSAFTDARWEEFGKDTRWLRAWLNPKLWEKVLTDLGYNPAPPWTVLGTPLSNLIDIRSRAGWLIYNSDVPLYLLMFAACWWAFGLRVTAGMLLWLQAVEINEGRWAGGFLQYDWLASCLVALALFRRGRHASAGVVLSWGAMTRVFPGFLVFPLVAHLLWDLVSGRRPGSAEDDRPGLLPAALVRRTGRPRLAFLLAFSLSCGALLVGSHLTGQGLSTWPAWVDKISRHSDSHPITSSERLGVHRMALHQPRPGRFWSSVPGKKEERLHNSAGRRHFFQALGLLLLLPALVRRRDEDAMTLMLFSVFLAVTLSRYYCSVWVMLFALGGRDRDGPVPWPALFAGSVLLGMAAWFHAPDTVSGWYWLANYEAYAMFALLCLGWLGSDLKFWMKNRSPRASHEELPESI